MILSSADFFLIHTFFQEQLSECQTVWIQNVKPHLDPNGYENINQNENITRRPWVKST